MDKEIACVTGYKDKSPFFMKEDKSYCGDLRRACASHPGYTELDLVRIVQDCINKGVDVNTVFDHGKSFLFYACGNGQADSAKILLEAGADINARTSWGVSAFDFSYRRGYTEVVKILLQYGACNDLQRPLRLACSLGFLDLVKLFIEEGADIDDTYSGSGTILMMSCRHRDNELFTHLLLKGANVNLTDSIGYSPLYYACARNNVGMVKSLIENGANVNQTLWIGSHSTEFGATALRIACCLGNAKIVQLLLEQKVDLTTVNSVGHTALTSAHMSGRDDIVELLEKEV